MRMMRRSRSVAFTSGLDTVGDPDGVLPILEEQPLVTQLTQLGEHDGVLERLILRQDDASTLNAESGNVQRGLGSNPSTAGRQLILDLQCCSLDAVTPRIRRRRSGAVGVPLEDTGGDPPHA